MCLPVTRWAQHCEALRRKWNLRTLKFSLFVSRISQEINACVWLWKWQPDTKHSSPLSFYFEFQIIPLVLSLPYKGIECKMCNTNTMQKLQQPHIMPLMTVCLAVHNTGTHWISPTIWWGASCTNTDSPQRMNPVMILVYHWLFLQCHHDRHFCLQWNKSKFCKYAHEISCWHHMWNELQ